MKLASLMTDSSLWMQSAPSRALFPSPVQWCFMPLSTGLSDMADTKLWPMAVQQSCFIWNHMPNTSTGLSPADVFTKVHWLKSNFHDTNVWGHLVYVLDKRIADGNKIFKWKPRSHRCVSLGMASSYTSSIPLCLNLKTRFITPQFHVVFDNCLVIQLICLTSTLMSGTSSLVTPHFSLYLTQQMSPTCQTCPPSLRILLTRLLMKIKLAIE